MPEARRARRLTVSRLEYPRPPRYAGGASGLRTVPYLRVRGLWLERLGFHPGSRVRVEAERGRLVLTAEAAEAGDG